MIASLRVLVHTKYPFRLRLLAYGAGGGGLISLVSLVMGQSPDLATTAGLAGCVSITVGIWVGTALVKWSLYLTVRRIVSALAPVLEALQDLKHVTGERGRAGGLPEGKLPWHRRVRVWCQIDLPVFCLILTPVLVLLVLLDLGYGLYDLNYAFCGCRSRDLGVGQSCRPTPGNLAIGPASHTLDSTLVNGPVATTCRATGSEETTGSG